MSQKLNGVFCSSTGPSLKDNILRPDERVYSVALLVPVSKIIFCGPTNQCICSSTDSSLKYNILWPDEPIEGIYVGGGEEGNALLMDFKYSPFQLR